MKVYLNTCPETTHTLYTELINYPPEGVEYRYPQKLPGAPTLLDKLKSELIYRSLLRKKVLTPVFQKLVSVRNQRMTERCSSEWYDCSVVHFCGTAHDIETPWVVDFEHIGSFTGYCRKWDWWLTTAEFKRETERLFSSKHCNHILPWSYAGLRTVERCLDTRKFKHKMEVVHLAFHAPPLTPRKEKERVRLLFMGSINLPHHFLIKGGVEALECFKILAKNYDVELVVRCKVPPKVLKKYKGVDGIIFRPEILPRTELDELYRSADIFISPAPHPPYMVMLEALSFGLPVVALDLWTNPELIDDGNTGYLVKPSPHTNYYSNFGVPTPHAANILGRVDMDLVNRFASKVAILVEDLTLRRELGRNARKTIETGQFSITERNKKLKRIYEEASE